MIVTVDTETQGLNTNAYICGTTCTENETITEHKNQQQHWQHLQNLATKETKRGKTLYIYGFNITYDYYAITPRNEPNLKKTTANGGFTAKYWQNNKPIIWFLNIQNFFKQGTNLATAAELIGEQKTETPEKLKTETPQTYTQQELKQIQDYCNQDTLITMKLYKHIKKTCNQNNVKPRRLISIGQIGIAWTNKYIHQQNLQSKIFRKPKQSEWYYTYNKTLIARASRGGRTQALQHGKYENITMIDTNSLYPYIATQIQFPFIPSEKKIEQPQKLTTKLGISKAKIKIHKKKLGIVPIRYQTNQGPKSITLNHNCTAIGTWTNTELNKFEQEGHEIQQIEYTIEYENTKNIFQQIMPQLYEKRKQPGYNGHFYKTMMNSIIGKFAQQTTEEEEITDDINQRTKRENQGYELTGLLHTDGIFTKPKITTYPKYYCPIINAEVRAKANIFLYENMKKINTEDILYCDTDAIMFKNRNNLQHYTIGNELGEWKIVETNTNALIYGQKSYSLGNNIKASGVSKIFLNKKDFEKGKIKYKRMKTEYNSKNDEEIGSFENLERDFNEQTKKEKEQQKEIKEQTLIIDAYEKDTKTLLKR